MSQSYDFERTSLGAYALEILPEFEIADHHQEIISALLEIEKGENDRLIITAPPRHSKSILASEFFQSWCMGRKPSRQMILATYGQDLTLGFGRRIKNTMTSPEFAKIFPACKVNQDSHSTNRIETSERGVWTGSSVGGAVTGKGADIFTVDDPVKDRAQAESHVFRQGVWDWYTSTARTRLQPGGAIVVISTRWHEDDLSGRLLQKGGWKHVHLKAIGDGGGALWPSWFDLDALQSLRTEIGSYDWEALYQGEPTRIEGSLFAVDRLNYYDAKDMPPFIRVFQTLDTASKTGQENDYSVIATWGESKDHNLYLIDVVIEKVEYPDLKRMVKSGYEQWKPMVMIIEDANSGTQLIQEFRNLGINIIAVNPTKDKMTRALPFSAGIEAGRVFLPKNHHHTQYVTNELRQFPAGKNDDFVDAGTMAWDYINKAKPTGRMKHPGMPG